MAEMPGLFGRKNTLFARDKSRGLDGAIPIMDNVKPHLPTLGLESPCKKSIGRMQFDRCLSHAKFRFSR